MKEQIKGKIAASGGALSAEEAYWALGGKERAAQLKRETTQREIAKRSIAKRTVQTDTSAVPSGDKPLPAEVRQAAKAAGISEKEARRLVDMPNDLEGYRKWKKQGRA
jgi:phage I-like protein